MSIRVLFGQDAIRHIIQQHNGKVTPEQIKIDLDVLIKSGIAAPSLRETRTLRLNAMVKSYELKKRTDKQGNVLEYERIA